MDDPPRTMFPPGAGRSGAQTEWESGQATTARGPRSQTSTVQVKRDFAALAKS